MTEAYPLKWPDGWPRANGRIFGGFQVPPLKAALSLLENVRKLGATHVVISSNCPIRSDGTPYTDSLTERFPDPGVAIYFQFRARPMVMAQDAFLQPYANMRSLALAIEAMRSIERHGGGHMMRRSFDGFAALPPPAGSTSAPARPWRDVLAMADVPATIAAEYQRPIAEDRYRKLAKERHPDTPTGSADAFAELNRAITEARAELA